jgi:Na+-driven multidrug efflux pump
MMPLMVTSFLNLIASTFMFWLFISYLDYGYIGASMSLTVSNLFQMLLNLFAAKFSIKYPTWPQYNLRDACDPAGALELLRLSLPGALTVWSEWWAWVIPSHKI